MEITLTEKKALPTLCLNMIVKNESKIITRLLDSVIGIIDSYCICDTGSTDNTVDVITQYFESKNIIGKIVFEPFKNFAHTRNASLKHCEGMSDYVIFLDADMVLKVNKFEKSMLLCGDSFSILQGTDEFLYHNMRIVKNNGMYSYYGVTHEYINTPSNNRNVNIEKDVLFIHDIGDGGAKSDKFERDVALLTKGIEDEPDSQRYHFYLANTYFDSWKHEEAIEYYRKRINLGGWQQEVWYSLYRIGHTYKRMGKMQDAIFTWLEAYDYFPDRIENLYEIINYYRDVGKCKLALTFYNLAKDILNKNLKWHEYLFLQNDVYTYKLEYEYSIFACYNGIQNTNKQIVTVLNNTNDGTISNNVFSNMKFYKDILTPKKNIQFGFSLNHLIGEEYTHFNSSSSCIIPNKTGNGYLLNVRLVNYKIDNQGYYHDCDKHIITINKYFELTKEFKIKKERMIDVEYEDRRYIGVEDVRIFNHKSSNSNSNSNSNSYCNNDSEIDSDDEEEDSSLLFIGTGYHKDNKIGIVVGKYEPMEEDNVLKPIEIKPSFNVSECEKNWVYANLSGDLNIVYKWSPLTLCKIDETARVLNLVRTIDMPKIFNYVRGSTNGFNYKNEIWFVGHLVSYEQPRHYYHIFSVFDENMKLLRYSAPFKFNKECIEYCLGLIVEDDRVICSYSSWDRTTNIAVYDKTYIDGVISYN
uniref:Glycosyltransferase 2-like domain-containing protein n=1 Tax=viral metagenome TaxID=1070528 RepID=A0A6C0HQR5_9ZZZZ